MVLILHVAAALFATAAAQSISAPETVSILDDLSQQSFNLQGMAKIITPPNIFQTGPQLYNSFSSFVKKAESSYNRMNGAPAQRNAKSSTYTSKEQQGVCKAFAAFVTIHRNYQDVVDSKGSMFANTPFNSGMLNLLQSNEGILDSIAYVIIDEVPVCETDATANKTALDNTLSKVIDTYSGLAVLDL